MSSGASRLSRLTISAMASAIAVPGTTVSSDEIAGVPDRGAEHAVVEEPDVVVEADPVAVADQRRLGEAQLHHLDGRIDEHPAVDRDERRDQNAPQPASRCVCSSASGPAFPMKTGRRRHQAPAVIVSTQATSRASSAAFISATAVAGIHFAVDGGGEGVAGRVEQRRCDAGEHRLGIVDHVGRQHGVGRLRLHRLVLGQCRSPPCWPGCGRRSPRTGELSSIHLMTSSTAACFSGVAGLADIVRDREGSASPNRCTACRRRPAARWRPIRSSLPCACEVGHRRDFPDAVDHASPTSPEVKSATVAG